MPALEFAVWDQMQTYEVLHAQSAADVYDTHIRQAQLMERVGFGYYWTLEHQGSYVGAITSPQIFLTALAQHTESLRLGAMIWQLPFHNPVRLAQDVAMLDHLSRGRAEFATGIGVHEHEFMRWGLDFYARQEMGEEALDIIELAWGGDGTVTYEGKFWKIDEALVHPMPYQQPHPPIWAAVHSPRAIDFAAKRGYHMAQNIDTDESMARKFDQWRQAWKGYGHTGPMPRQFLMRVVHVAKTDEQAHEQARQYLLEANTLGRDIVTSSRIGLGSHPRGMGSEDTEDIRERGAHLPRDVALLRFLARPRPGARGQPGDRGASDSRRARADRVRPLRREVSHRAHAAHDGGGVAEALRRGSDSGIRVGVIVRGIVVRRLTTNRLVILRIDW